MSFIIAICRDSEAIIACDRRVSNSNINGDVISISCEDYIKIVDYSFLNEKKHYYLAFGGSLELAEKTIYSIKKIVEKINTYGTGKCSIKDFADIILKTSKTIIEENNFNEKIFHNNFILISKTNFKNYTTSISLPQYELCNIDTKLDKVQFFTTHKNEFLYVYAHSKYIKTDEVENIISKYLNKTVPINNIAKEIIRDVSKIDITVNDKAFLRNL